MNRLHKQALEQIPEITIASVMERYAVLLLDAYGVLIHSQGALDGAEAFIDRLNSTGKPYFILTNDASKLPETAAALFRSYGLAIDPDRIVTSGSLLHGYFAENGLAGARCAVLGPADSRRYVSRAGGRIVSCHEDFDVLVIGDESGFPFIETVDTVLSTLLRKHDGREPLHLVLPNPDLIYPKADRSFGFASGSIALMFEAAMRSRYPHRPGLRFDRLGKPHVAIFEEAYRRSGSRQMVMIGDQLETDIRGANGFGIDSVLMTGGMALTGAPIHADILRPTFRMGSLAAT